VIVRALKEELVICSDDECSVELQNYHQILEDGLRALSEFERKAIFLRFWGPYSIAQVATELRMTWEAADRLIDGAIIKLRESFRQHRYYRRPLSEGNSL